MTQPLPRAVAEPHAPPAGLGPPGESDAARLARLAGTVDALLDSVRRIEYKLAGPGAQAPAALPPVPDVLHVGELVIDGPAYRVVLCGRPLELSPVEYSVLVELARRPGQAVRTSELMRLTRGGFSPEKSYVKVYISRLRAKIAMVRGEGACVIEVVRGFGYRLAVATAMEVPARPASVAVV